MSGKIGGYLVDGFEPTANNATIAAALRAEANKLDPQPTSQPVVSPVGTKITPNTGKIIANDGAEWTIKLEPTPVGPTDFGLYRNNVYVSGSFVTSLTFQGNNTFLETTTAYGTWVKVWDGTKVVSTIAVANTTPNTVANTTPNTVVNTTPNTVVNTAPTTPPVSQTPVGTFPALPTGYTTTKVWDFRTATPQSTLAQWPEWKSINRNIGSDHTPDCITFQNGYMRFIAKYWGQNGTLPNSTGGKVDWKTGGIETQGRWTQQYGFFEARCRWARLPGLRSAFWAMFADPGTQAWPYDGEWDAFEWKLNEEKVYVSAALAPWSVNDVPNRQKYYTYKPGERVEDFHNYGMEWKPDGFLPYFDGKPGSFIPMRGDRFPFGRPFFLFINMMIGYDGPANRADESKLTMDVEWIRAAKI